MNFPKHNGGFFIMLIRALMHFFPMIYSLEVYIVNNIKMQLNWEQMNQAEKRIATAKLKFCVYLQGV